MNFGEDGVGQSLRLEIPNAHDSGQMIDSDSISQSEMFPKTNWIIYCQCLGPTAPTQPIFFGVISQLMGGIPLERPWNEAKNSAKYPAW